MEKIVHKDYTVEIEPAELYVDNQSRQRSGHMSHALAEFAPNCIIDFNSNCSALRWGGHSPYGWIEYRISRDGGKTFSPIYDLPYAKQSFYDGMHTIAVEKAVACDDGTIVAFCLRCTSFNMTCCEPWTTPTFITSTDGGETWSEAQEFIPYEGRIYDACYRDGTIYVLIHCSNEFFSNNPEEEIYRIYKSDDNAKTWEKLCDVPFPDVDRRGYGSMLFDEYGDLHVFAYNEKAEKELDHVVSKDGGKTFEVQPPCYLAKGIRNPQTALIDGIYVIHGRRDCCDGFVLYTSPDMKEWDEGYMLVDKKGVAYYSNNINLKDEQGNFLLIQYSDNYEGNYKVNVMHQRIRIKRH